MVSATAPLVTNLPTMETCVYIRCMMSAEMEKHVHSTETVWTDISGYFTAESRLDLVQSHDMCAQTHTQTHTPTDASTEVQQR